MIALEFNKEKKEYRKNKRLFMRSVRPIETICRFQSLPVSRPAIGILHSISQSGIFVKSRNMPDIGEPVLVNFDFLNHKIKAVGTVLYKNPEGNPFKAQGFGIKFTRMYDKDHQALIQGIEGLHRFI